MPASPLRTMPREVGVLVGIAFAVALGFGIVAPAIPIFARDFGVGRAAAAAVVSAFALTRLLFALTSGRLVDRYGERRILTGGIAVVAVSSALAGVSQSYAELIVLRGVGGVGSAMFVVSAYNLLLAAVEPGQRGRATGLYRGGFLLGGISGPALGGFLTGVDVRAPFFIYAAMLGVAGALAMRTLRPPARPAPDATDRRPEPLALRAAFRVPGYRAALFANLADSWAVLGVRSALVPLFVADVLHRRPLWTGIGFVVVAVVNAATLLPAGQFSDTRGRRPVLVTGCLVLGCGVTVLATLENLFGYLVAMAVIGLGSGLLDVAPAAIVGDVADRRGGRVIAAYQMAGDLGVIVGPVVAGHLADVASYGWAFGLTAVILWLAAGVGALAPEVRH